MMKEFDLANQNKDEEETDICSLATLLVQYFCNVLCPTRSHVKTHKDEW